MANTTPVYARIDTNLKKDAEAILTKLGISTSSLITMVYSQIVLRGGLPFDIILPEEPVVENRLSKEEFEKEIIKGLESLDNDKTYSIDEVEALLKSL